MPLPTARESQMPTNLSIGDAFGPVGKAFGHDNVIGIDPRVDYACKRVLGSPADPNVTIHFLNAVLQPESPITSVTIENPITAREAVDDKACVLDLLTSDATGRRTNVEVQTDVPPGLANRMTYYVSKLLVSQISIGEGYHEIQPVASICILSGLLCRIPARLHHAFRLRDRDGQVFGTAMAIHLIQLPQLRDFGDNEVITDPVEQWAYFFEHAATSTPRQLFNRLPDPALHAAIRILMTISQKAKDRLAYDAREKFRLDTIWRERAAKQEGWQQGRQEGRQEGIQQGMLIGEIHAKQSALGQPLSDVTELQKLSLEQLRQRRDHLTPPAG